MVRIVKDEQGINSLHRAALAYGSKGNKGGMLTSRPDVLAFWAGLELVEQGKSTEYSTIRPRPRPNCQL
jgi:hypothetical protein